MGFQIDFDDLLTEPEAKKVPPAAKFQPKLRPRPRKEVAKPVPSAQTGVTVTSEKPVKHSIQPVDIETKEPLRDGEDSYPQVPFSNDNIISESENPSTKLVDGSEYWQCTIEKSTGENGDLFFGLECLDDLLSQPENTTDSADCHISTDKKTTEESVIPVTFDAASAKAFPQLSETQDPATHSEATICNNDGCFHIANEMLETQEAEIFPSFDTQNIMPQATTISGQPSGKFLPKPKMQIERKKPITGISNADVLGSDPRIPNVPLGVSVEYMEPITDPDVLGSGPHNPDMDENGSLPSFLSDDVDFSSVNFGDSVPVHFTSELQVDEQPTTAQQKAPEGKSVSTGEQNGPWSSSRQLRKGKAAYRLVDEPEEEAYNDGDFIGEPSSNAFADEDEDYNTQSIPENNSRKRRPPRKSKETVPGEENTCKSRKAKKAPDQSTPKPKKFSHSTRQKRRRVDPNLLQIPEDELDHRRVPIKDLLLLAEFKERAVNKEATKPNAPPAEQSTDDYGYEDAPFGEMDSFASEKGGDPASPKAKPCPLLNYQTYSNREPRKRWSKEETELFYQGVRQFGADISLIQQLFPDKTRHQVKLKYKWEERRHCSTLFDALASRDTDRSFFERVIEKLQENREAENNSDVENSTGMVNEENAAEQVIPESNGELSKSMEKGEESIVENMEDVAPEFQQQSPVKSAYESDEDDDLRWSQYTSDL